MGNEKLKIERELSALQAELDQYNSQIDSLRSRAALTISGLSEDNIRSEQLRGESLMQEMCSIRVLNHTFTSYIIYRRRWRRPRRQSIRL